MAVTPQFIEIPFLWQARVSGQAPARDNPAPSGTLQAVFLGVASAQGAVIESLWAVALGTFADTTLRLWLKRPGDSIPYLLRETAIAAATLTDTSASLTAIPLPDILAPASSDGLRLGASVELYVSLGVAATPGFHICAQGGHYGTGYGGTGGGTP
jgi:hypothetical protein